MTEAAFHPDLHLPPGSSSLDNRPLSILVVDDDEANRESLARRLQRRGYQVAVAVDGPDALAHIEQHAALDLVLLDVMMPGMSGLEVLQRVREAHSSTRLPIIMATAKDQSTDVVKAFELGANDYVIKPLDFAVVLARVQTHLTMKRSVEQIIELEQRLNERNLQLEDANHQLRDAATRAQHELNAAAKIQETFLPQSLPLYDGVQFAWTFKPCQELAGDSLNVCPLDDEHVGLYVLDVTGHGVAASLTAVSANRALSPASDPQSMLVQRTLGSRAVQPVPPSEVAERLTRKFAWNDATAQFLTCFYAVLNAKTRTLTYTSAGHPGAVRVAADGATTLLDGTGLPIGLGEHYEQHSVELIPGDRVYLYSDGVTETMNPTLTLFGNDNLYQALATARPQTLQDSIAALVQTIDTWRGDTPARDDVSILALEIASV